MSSHAVRDARPDGRAVYGILAAVTSEESATPHLLELLGDLLGALERRDYEEAMSYFGPDPVWDMSAIGTGIFSGPKAIRGLLEDWNGSYEEWTCEAEEVCDLGRGIVLVVLNERGRPVGSTARVQLRYALVAALAQGMIVRTRSYLDVDHARAAAERLACSPSRGSGPSPSIASGERPDTDENQ